MRMPWPRRQPSTGDSSSRDEGGDSAVAASDPANDGMTLTSPDDACEPGSDADSQPVPSVPTEALPQANTPSANVPDTRILLRVAEEAWRLGRRVDRAASDVGEAPLADIRDALQRLRDILSEAGIEAVDHDGERYVDGLRIHILHVEGDAADSIALRVVRTIRPSILADGRVAVSGHVILGPADQETTTP